MAHTACQVVAFPSRPVSSLIAPREHGAWGLLFVPLITGGASGLLAGGNWPPLAAFATAAFALFWLRTPMEAWMGAGLVRPQTQRERQAVAVTILTLSALAVLALGALFWSGHNRGLLVLGAFAAVAFLLQTLLRKLGRRTRMLSQIVGTIGLTVTAPAAYYLATGQLNRQAWTLWAANFLFAGNQIHFVQLRIHSARLNGWSQKFRQGRVFLAGEVLMTAALVLAWRFHLLSWLAALAFLPLIVRGAAWFFEGQTPLLVRRLGWTELTYAIVFGICFIAGFRLR